MAEEDLIESCPLPLLFPKCIDYRRLNKVTIPDCMTLPRYDDSLDALGGVGGCQNGFPHWTSGVGFTTSV